MEFGNAKAAPGQLVIDAAYSANQVNNLISGSYEYNAIHPQNYSLGLSLQDQVPNP